MHGGDVGAADVILAVDTGMATCGWAVVEPRTGIVLDLGIVTSEPSPTLGKQADRVARMQHQATQLEHVIARHNCGVLAAETLSFPPRGKTNAVAAVCLCWGLLVGLSTSHSIPLHAITPKQWQHAVLASDSKIDYEQVFEALHHYVEGQAHVASKLLRIPKSKRNHVLDAVAVGVYAARNIT